MVQRNMGLDQLSVLEQMVFNFNGGFMSIKKGGGIGSPVLGGFSGTRAESNFHPMGVSSNRGGALAGSIIRGGFENRGVEGNGPKFGVIGM